MAITSVTENFIGLTAMDQLEGDGSISGGGSRFFDVEFAAGDETADRPFLAKADSRVPQLGDQHSAGEWIFVKNRSVKVASKSHLLYIVTVNYSEIQNPLVQRPIVKWLTASTMEPIDVDISGKPILNSSDEPFDPPPTEEFDDLILRATWNQLAFDPVLALEYKGAINMGPFLGFPAGKAKTINIDNEEVRHITGNFYVRMSVEIQFRQDGWKRQFLDQGLREKTGTDANNKPTYAEIIDDNGKLVSDPVLLDGAGKKLADGVPIVRIPYDTKPTKNYLGFYQTFITLLA